LLAAYLALKPGEYRARLSASSESGEERTITIDVTVEPMATVPLNATQPTVILINGWQLSCPITVTTPLSASTFYNLQEYLLQFDNVPVVYWFDNCAACPAGDCSIEQLGADLAQVITSIDYENSTPVSQVDLIAHSMGGLIVRSYLSGKQGTSGVFNPPTSTGVRKAIFIATPHFGSFQADSALAGILFFAGNQTNEMKRGSQFIWDLARWNQFGDDLRGTDALSVIGNAGSFESLSGASDGVVVLTSGSLDFAEPGRTRIVKYCHIPLSPGLEAAYLGCTGPGIAHIDTFSHPTYEIVSSFLMNGTAWESVGNAPLQDPYLSTYGGLIFADLSSNDQYLNPGSVSRGSVSLTTGAAGYLYYADFVSGTGTFAFGSSTCGPYTQPIGVYSEFRCKSVPLIYAVGPLLTGTAKVVQAGTTITINGLGFGPSQCSGCQVIVAPPGSTTGYSLSVSSWTDQVISAFLPATLPGLSIPGLVTICVELSTSAWDSINIMAAPPAPAALSILKTHTGSFTQGQQNAAYQVTVSNAASAGPTSGTVTVTETVPSGLMLVSMAGTGWTCPGTAAYNCTRSDPLNGGASYPTITVAVNVAANATSPQVNAVSVSGGGSVPANTTDSTVITANPAVLSITKTHSGNFTQGQQNATYSVNVSNAANAAPTSGTVTVTETVPTGMTLVSMSGGTTWNCTGNICTTSNVLNGGQSYAAIMVMVNVTANAASPQVNAVLASGGGSLNAYTTDSTTITGAGMTPDLVWQNDTTRQVTVWYMGGAGGNVLQGWNYLSAAGIPGWHVVAVADFNGDGVPDLVWQNDTTRQATIWYMGGTGGAVLQSYAYLSATGVPGWSIVAAADFNGDGVPDLVWQNDTTRQVTVWYMGGVGGAVFQGYNYLSAAGVPGWHVVAVADFNGDGVPDLVWQNDSTRQVTVWYMGGAGGATLQGYNWLSQSGVPGWHVVAAVDQNGDGVPDPIWQNDSTRQVTVWYMGGAGGAVFQGWSYLSAAGVPGWSRAQLMSKEPIPCLKK